MIGKMLLSVLIGGAFMTVKGSAPRGIRNNNPGNIRHSDANDWQGQVGIDDAGFVIFDSPQNGVRAMTKILKNYAKRGVVTLEQIISTWAPPEGINPITREPYGNDTASYIRHVAQLTGIEKGEPVAPVDYPALIDAISRHENAGKSFSMGVIEKGVSIA